MAKKITKTVRATAAPALRLKEILLPEGDVGSVTIAWPGTTGESIRLPEPPAGFDGYRLIGKGVEKTQVRCTSWDGVTLKAGRHNGLVQLEGVTLVAGYSRAAFIGAPNKSLPLAPKFGFAFKGSRLFIPEPAPGKGRTKWGFHTYNADMLIEDSELDATFASEHASYEHGHASKGSLWRRVTVRGSGAENDKVRSDATETLWAGPGVWIIREDVEYSNWYQEWSDRGGAASVRQGSGAHNRWSRCTFRCGKALGTIPGHLRSRTIMVTSESDSYDVSSGVVNKPGGFGNGQVIVEQCGASGGPGTENLSLLMRVGKVGGAMQAARSALVDSCGLWGERMQLQFDSVPSGGVLVRGCNTPGHKAYCDALGMDTRHEAVVATSQRVVPLSEGFVR